jgi:hypothetical protein
VSEALLFFEEGQDVRVKQEALAILSEIMLAQGDVEAAANHLQASLSICEILYHQLQATGKLEGTPAALPVDLIRLCACASLVATVQGNHEHAVTLCSIADSLSTRSGQAILQPLQVRLDQAMSSTRLHLSESDFNRRWNTGQQMSIKQAFNFLLT